MDKDQLKDRLDRDDEILKEHSKRIGALERSDAANNVRIDNLCEKIESQTKSLNYLIATLATSVLGIFIYFIQIVIGNMIN